MLGLVLVVWGLHGAAQGITFAKSCDWGTLSRATVRGVCALLWP